MRWQCLLLVVKRTSRRLIAMSAFDPKRTSADRVCCNARRFSHNELYKGRPLPDSTRAAPRTAFRNASS
jgi:hypothetical protein